MKIHPFLSCGLLTVAVLLLTSTITSGGELLALRKPCPPARVPSQTNGPAYTVANPPGHHAYYFVPQNVEVYPWYGGVPAFRWGYFGATRHSQCIAPFSGYYNDYYQTTRMRGD